MTAARGLSLKWLKIGVLKTGHRQHSKLFWTLKFIPFFFFFSFELRFTLTIFQSPFGGPAPPRGEEGEAYYWALISLSQRETTQESEIAIFSFPKSLH